MRPETLERMVNQVAANAGSDRDGAVGRVATHLRTFWTPDMIADLADFASTGAVHLTDVADAALAQVRSNP